MDVGVEGDLPWMLEWKETYHGCWSGRRPTMDVGVEYGQVIVRVVCYKHSLRPKELPALSRLTTCGYRPKIKDTSIAESSALLQIDNYDNGCYSP